MRKLRIACILLLIGTVALLPLHQKVESATGNYNANHLEAGNSAALPPASGVCLVLYGSNPEKNQDPKWVVGKNKASIRTENGEVRYTFQMPERICPGGSSATLTAQAIADRGAPLGAIISLGGEVDGQGSIQAPAEPGEVKQKEGTVIIKPSSAYTENTYPTIKVWMAGGSQTLTIEFHYSIEQASTGNGMQLEYDIDRPGQDYKNFNLAEARPELCQAECSADSNCRAFTYVKPGVQAPSARCWLKSGVPPATRSSCCVSGFKG